MSEPSAARPAHVCARCPRVCMYGYTPVAPPSTKQALPGPQLSRRQTGLRKLQHLSLLRLLLVLLLLRLVLLLRLLLLWLLVLLLRLVLLLKLLLLLLLLLLQ